MNLLKVIEKEFCCCFGALSFYLVFLLLIGGWPNMALYVSVIYREDFFCLWWGIMEPILRILIFCSNKVYAQYKTCAEWIKVSI